MKIAVVGDIIVSSGLLAEAAKSLNIDDEPELARRENIEVVPTLVLYKNGQAVDTIVGPGSQAAVEEFIRKNS